MTKKNHSFHGQMSKEEKEGVCLSSQDPPKTKGWFIRPQLSKVLQFLKNIDLEMNTSVYVSIFR